MTTTFILFSLLTNLWSVDATREPIEILLDQLAVCESSNRPKVINPKDYGSASFSLYQFKIETFVWAGRKYGLPHDDIWSPEQQRAIAKALILDDRTEHWTNCFKKMGL